MNNYKIVMSIIFLACAIIEYLLIKNRKNAMSLFFPILFIFLSTFPIMTAMDAYIPDNTTESYIAERVQSDKNKGTGKVSYTTKYESQRTHSAFKHKCLAYARIIIKYNIPTILLLIEFFAFYARQKMMDRRRLRNNLIV